MFWDRFKKKPPQLPAPATTPQTEVMEQLYLLRDQSLTTGLLFEAQRVNLDYWIWIALPNITEHELIVFPEVSPNRPMERSVSYKIKAKGSNPPDLEARLSLVSDWVQTLLGLDVVVRYTINDVKVYEREARGTKPSNLKAALEIYEPGVDPESSR